MYIRKYGVYGIRYTAYNTYRFLLRNVDTDSDTVRRYAPPPYYTAYTIPYRIIPRIILIRFWLTLGGRNSGECVGKRGGCGRGGRVVLEISLM